MEQDKYTDGTIIELRNIQNSGRCDFLSGWQVDSLYDSYGLKSNYRIVRMTEYGLDKKLLTVFRLPMQSANALMQELYTLNSINCGNIIHADAFERIDIDNSSLVLVRTPIYESIEISQMSHEDVISLGIDICSALEVCHANRIIHGAIMPGCIYKNAGGEYMLGHFGLKYQAGANAAFSGFMEEDSVYAAPEIIKGRGCDNRSDIYSLAIVLYTILNNGIRPVPGAELPPLGSVTPPLMTVIYAASQQNPMARLANISQFKSALLSCSSNRSGMPPVHIPPHTVVADESTIPLSYPARQYAPPPVMQPQPKKGSGGLIAVVISLVAVAALILLLINVPFVKSFISSKLGLTTTTTVTTVTTVPTSHETQTTTAEPGIVVGTETLPTTTTTKKPTSSTIVSSESMPPIASWKSPSASPIDYGASYKPGDIFTFGSYDQDDKTDNGSEPIEWIVLDTDGSSIYAVAKYGIECKKYNEKKEATSWETCTLRQWLNDEFYTTAFSEEEISHISETYADYTTLDGSFHVYDKVSLLSMAEVKEYFSSQGARRAAPTPHAIKNGAYKSSSQNAAVWWLRDTGKEYTRPGYVDHEGKIYNYGIICTNYTDCVRPAITISF